MDALTPDDIRLMVEGAEKKPGTGQNKSGDLRIGKKLLQFRADFGFSRRTLAGACGISITSITRLELGQRMFSAHSLSGFLVGARNLTRLIHPRRGREFDKWAFDFLDTVYMVEEEERIQRRRNKQRSLTTEDGRR